MASADSRLPLGREHRAAGALGQSGRGWNQQRGDSEHRSSGRHRGACGRRISSVTTAPPRQQPPGPPSAPQPHSGRGGEAGFTGWPKLFSQSGSSIPTGSLGAFWEPKGPGLETESVKPQMRGGCDLGPCVKVHLSELGRNSPGCPLPLGDRTGCWWL